VVRWCLQEHGNREGERLLRAGDWELPATRHGLDDNVRLFYAGGEELGFGASEEGLNYC
jgi:hypothetical protein